MTATESSSKSHLELKQLHDRCMGHIEFAEGLLNAYFDSTESDLPELERAVARGDLLRVASMAHRIKRCALKVGATSDSVAAEKIETCCRSGYVEQLPLEVAALRRVHKETNQEWSAR